jgi:hypothetical protein
MTNPCHRRTEKRSGLSLSFVLCAPTVMRSRSDLCGLYASRCINILTMRAILSCEGRCDDSKCTSIGSDCYAPGDEAKTCAPGFHAEDFQDDGRYSCCALCPDGFHHCTSAQANNKGQEVLGLLGAFCDRDPDCYGDDGYCDGTAQTGCIAAPTGSWDGVTVYLSICLSLRRKRL